MPHIQPDPPPGLHRLTVNPGVTTAAELLATLAAVPAGAVLMSASSDLDGGSIELVDLAADDAVDPTACWTCGRRFDLDDTPSPTPFGPTHPHCHRDVDSAVAELVDLPGSVIELGDLDAPFTPGGGA